MLSIKKVQVVPLEINNGAIIDSFNTQDDHHGNAPSLNAVEDYVTDIANNKADKSTTLSGYGITDAYTKTEVDTIANGKANTSTTLAGYGITNAYTKTESDNNYQPKVLSGTSNPSSGLGNNGDIYLQYS